MIDLSNTCLFSPPIPNVNISNEILSSYPDLSLINSFNNCIGEYLSINKNNILSGNGSAELIDVVISSLNVNDVIIFTPTFFLYERFAIKNKKNIYYYNLSEILRDGIKSLVINKKTLIILVNPNNPTSENIPANIINELLMINHAFVLIDESFIEYGGESFVKKALMKDNLIVLRSLSKSFGIAGARIGYCITTEKNIEKFKENKDPLSSNNIGLQVAIECITSQLNEFKVRWENIKKMRELFLSVLRTEKINITANNCNFSCFQFKRYSDAQFFYNLLKEENIICRMGNHWEFTKGSENMLRISIVDTYQFNKCIEKIQLCINRYEEDYE